MEHQERAAPWRAQSGGSTILGQEMQAHHALVERNLSFQVAYTEMDGSDAGVGGKGVGAHEHVKYRTNTAGPPYRNRP